jgi:hypothetical protein
LAVQVPDRDLDHLTYQDEHKTVADTGWWELHDRTAHPHRPRLAAPSDALSPGSTDRIP